MIATLCLLHKIPNGLQKKEMTLMKPSEAPKHYAYMLRCADGTIYSGYSTDPSRRAAIHNSGRGAKYTRSRLPVELVFSECFPKKSEALKREAALKRLSHAEKLSLISPAI
jgi:putative endonuclease